MTKSVKGTSLLHKLGGVFLDIIPFKPYYDKQTHDDQINKISEKNIDLSNNEINEIVRRLKNHSYYSLINGYKPHFLLDGKTDEMKPGTTFDHFYQCKLLEMDLSSVLFKYIQVIEQGFRARTSYIVAREFGTDHRVYLEAKYYVNTNNRRYKTLKYFRELHKKCNENSYSYYFKNQKKAAIPPWILFMDAEFYRVIILYSCLPQKLRDEIRHEYISPTNLVNENRLFADSLQLLREYRNIYAHSKRNFFEKINYSLDYDLSKFIPTAKLFDKNDFDSKKKSKKISTVVYLALGYLNDPFLCRRFQNDLLNLFINNGYVDKNYDGVDLFNGQTVYDILDLPIDFFKKVNSYLSI